jgi:hypothetical protein
VAENWGLSELVESATRCGMTDLARDATNRLAIKAQATRTDSALGIEARARALLDQDGDAERWFGRPSSISTGLASAPSSPGRIF